MTQILIVEDEKNVREGLVQFLSEEGYGIAVATDIAEAKKCVGLQVPDLVVLDWKLPDGQGIELLRAWRQQGLQFPVIMLTARAELIDKVLGLELGANDYMTKPFAPRELLARIRVQERLRQTDPPVDVSEVLESNQVRLDLRAATVSCREQSITLARKEFELLHLLMRSPGQTFSRDELLNQVWGFDQNPVTRTVDAHIVQLRHKLHPDFIETVRGFGYRWVIKGGV